MLQERICEEKQGLGKREDQIRQGGRKVNKITEGTAVETKPLESLLLALLLQMLWMCTAIVGAVVSWWWWSPLVPPGRAAQRHQNHLKGDDLFLLLELCSVPTGEPFHLPRSEPSSYLVLALLSWPHTVGTASLQRHVVILT